MHVSDTSAIRCKRVLLVDDHALFRGGMALLVMNHPLVREVQEAGNVVEALTHAGGAVHLVLLDHYMPGVTGINGIKTLRMAFPDAVVAIVSGSTSPQDMALARDNGADGFVAKTTGSHEIQTALSALLRGQRWFPDEIPTTEPWPDARVALTAKQVEVLALLAEGLSNRAIGKRMAVSENTVRSHVSAVLFQLRVNSRAEATVVARRLGLIQ
ncbi:MAG: response regulator transcription factor [Hydrogenophaga sp.]|jgi:DNA-binding NarL/FixJ family response regulator|nr:response regulator transcription factor [Hydrogenophaga sp.]